MATRIQPGNARAWNNLGVARARRGDDASAREAYETALELDELQSAHLNLAALYLRAGDLEKASEQLESARELDPNNPAIERLSGAILASETAPPPAARDVIR